MMPVFVGCDMGTMVTKSAVVDERGEILGLAAEEVPLITPRPGRAEQSLLEIEASARRTIRRALRDSGRAADVAAVAFSGQMSGIGAIDARFEPVMPFDSWLDDRCGGYIETMSEHRHRVTELSGAPPTYSHGPKILWWKHERPDLYRRIVAFVVPSAFVAARACGLSGHEAFIDRTHLHFSNLSDTRNSTWSPELIDAFGVDREKLPRIVDPLSVVGQITRATSAETGLPAGTPVAAGAGDQTAAALGAAVVEPGQAFDSAGTASVFATCVNGFAPDPERRAIVASHGVIPGTFISLAFINGGGLALRWMRDELPPSRQVGVDNPYAVMDSEAGAVNPGSDGLLWLPHFQGGVLPPAPSLRGGWVGITAGHTRAHLYRSILEGIAYEYAGWMESVISASGALEIREARAVGGGARSSLWNSIKADVLGIDWVPMRRDESGVLGDALIAAAACGAIGDLAATAGQWHQPGEAVRPDPVRHETYRAFRAAHHELSRATRGSFDRLARAQQKGTPKPSGKE